MNVRLSYLTTSRALSRSGSIPSRIWAYLRKRWSI